MQRPGVGVGGTPDFVGACNQRGGFPLDCKPFGTCKNWSFK
jgi:hypothetical protein